MCVDRRLCAVEYYYYERFVFAIFVVGIIFFFADCYDAPFAYAFSWVLDNGCTLSCLSNRVDFCGDWVFQFGLCLCVCVPSFCLLSLSLSLLVVVMVIVY